MPIEEQPPPAGITPEDWGGHPMVGAHVGGGIVGAIGPRGSIVTRRGRSRSPRDATHVSNILKLEAALWTFVWEADVEPTNNRAERALRRAVLWRRRSFGTQSEAACSSNAS